MKDRKQARGARRIAPAIGGRLTYANVMATAAVFIALGGSAWAVAANSVGTKQLKNNAVKTKKIGNGAVKASKLAGGAVVTSKLGDQAVNAAKLAGGAVTAAKLADTAVGADKLGLTSAVGESASNSNSPKSATASCPAGTTVIGGSAGVAGGVGVPLDGVAAISQSSGLALINGWRAHAYEPVPTDTTWRVHVAAFCIRS